MIKYLMALIVCCGCCVAAQPAKATDCHANAVVERIVDRYNVEYYVAAPYTESFVERIVVNDYEPQVERIVVREEARNHGRQQAVKKIVKRDVQRVQKIQVRNRKARNVQRVEKIVVRENIRGY